MKKEMARAAFAALAFVSAVDAKILPEALFIVQSQLYPWREQARGYLMRYPNQPLLVEPDLPYDKGGLLDNILIKISDIFQSIPQMVLIIIIVALVGQSMENLIIIFILTGWPGMYRMTRSKVLSLKQQEFVQALRAFGISDVKIAFKHLLPNTLGPVVVNITLSTAMFILQEASLSVLGYGVPMEIATWGNIINVITNGGTIRFDWLQYWWMWLPCALMLILFVLSINFIGDGLRDASDPTQIG